MSRNFRIIFSCACALAVGVVFLSYAHSVQARFAAQRSELLAKYGGDIVRIAVATHTIEAGKPIEAADIVLRDWVSELAPQQAITRIDDIIGKSVSVPVCAGMPLSKFNFREAGQSLSVPQGMVAISIPLSEKLGLSPHVQAGTKLAAYTSNADSTQRITSEILVLATSDGQAFANGMLTLAVPEMEVEKILAVSSRGELRFVVPAESLPHNSGKSPSATTDATTDKTTDAMQSNKPKGESKTKAGQVLEGSRSSNASVIRNTNGSNTAGGTDKAGNHDKTLKSFDDIQPGNTNLTE